MANEIIDTIKAAIKESGSNNDNLISALKSTLPKEESFKEFILARKSVDIGRYEDPIPLENNVLIMQVVNESNTIHSMRVNKSEFKEVKKSIPAYNLYISNRETTTLFSYAGQLPVYYLDYIKKDTFNPSKYFQLLKGLFTNV